VVEVARDLRGADADERRHTIRMSAHTTPKHLCYVTLNPNHVWCARTYGPAAALRSRGGVNGQMITLYDKGRHIPLMWTHLIPATLEGRAMHNVQNAMFAAALAFSLDIKLDAIRQALRTFDSTFFQGRANERIRRAPVQGDFRLCAQCHAVGAMAESRARLEVRGRRIVVVAGPGDRARGHPRHSPSEVAGRFDHYIAAAMTVCAGAAEAEVRR